MQLVGDGRRKLILKGCVLTAGAAAIQMIDKLLGLERVKRAIAKVNPGTGAGVRYHFVTTFSSSAARRRLWASLSRLWTVRWLTRMIWAISLIGSVW